MIRVLIVDDHPIFRFGVLTLLKVEPTTEVVGEAADGADAIAKASLLHPDVILMDINMPGINGIDAIKLILAEHPAIRILVLTMFNDDDWVFTAMRAGALGYLLKGAEATETIRAITVVHTGEAIFSPMIAQRIMHYFGRSHASNVLNTFADLTKREHEVLTLIAQGYTNQAITETLVLSPHTVRNYITSIFSKLQVKSRTEAIKRAKEEGLP